MYFGHLMLRTDLLEKTLMLGKIEGRKRMGWQSMRCCMASPTDGHEFEQAPEVGDRQGSLICRSPWGHIEWDTTGLLNWTDAHIVSEDVDILMFFLLMYWHPQNWYVGPSMVSDEDLDKL